MEKLKMYNIAVINQGHTENLGDIAINQVITQHFKNKGCRVVFLPFWDEKRVFNKFSKCNFLIKALLKFPVFVDTLNTIRIKKSIKNLNLDGAIIGGGELLSGHKGFNSSLACWTKELKKLEVPIALYGISGDVRMKEYLIKRNTRALKYFDYICVRDLNTKKIFEETYQVITNDVAPDVVFALNKITNSKTDITKHAKYTIFVPVPFDDKMKSYLNVSNIEEYKAYLVKLIKNNTAEKQKIIFTTTVKDDDEFIKSLFTDFKTKLTEHECIYQPYATLADFLSLLTDTDVVLSARMHAMILGLIHGCKITPIQFKEKLAVFQNEYNIDVNTDEVATLSFNGLNKMSNALLKSR